jgi:hypothetical protein
MNIILESNTNGRGLLLEGLNKRNVFPCETVRHSLSESTLDNNNKYKFMGIFLVGDKQNANGRIYPFERVIKPVCDKYIIEAIKQNFGGGELEHPNNLTLNPERFTHKITKFYYDGVHVIGEAIPSERGMGRVLRDFIDLGFRFGMSSRGVGTVEEGYVQDDFELHFVDAVMMPSAPGAYMKYGEYLRDVNESVMYNDLGIIQKDIETIKELIKETKTTKSDSDEKIIKQFDNFLNAIKKTK